MNPCPIPAVRFTPVTAIHPREVFERNPEFTGHEEQFRLRPHEWELYLWFDGRRTVQEISDVRKMELARIVATVEKLQSLALIRVVEISLEEFFRRFVEEPADGPAPEGKRVSAALRRDLGESEVEPTPSAAPVDTRPTRARVSAQNQASAQDELPLKGLLEFIIAEAGGGTVGQLAAYRVFLKVPNELLKQNGINTLNLVGADFVIRHAELRRILLGAVEEVLGRPYDPPTPARVSELATAIAA